MFESKLLVEYWSCDLSSNPTLLEVGRLPSRSLRTLWFYALVPGVWTFGTCQGCGEGEHIWSAGEKLQGFGNLNRWAKKKTATIFAVICFPLPAFYVEKNYEVGERDAIGATPQAFIDLRGFWSVKPYRNSSGKSPKLSQWVVNLAQPKPKGFHQGFFLFDHARWMSGTINRFGWAMRKRGIRPLWSSVGLQREEEIPWKVCCHGFS